MAGWSVLVPEPAVLLATRRLPAVLESQSFARQGRETYNLHRTEGTAVPGVPDGVPYDPLSTVLERLRAHYPSSDSEMENTGGAGNGEPQEAGAVGIVPTDHQQTREGGTEPIGTEASYLEKQERTADAIAGLVTGRSMLPASGGTGASEAVPDAEQDTYPSASAVDAG